jgi:hypothetical protein
MIAMILVTFSSCGKSDANGEDGKVFFRKVARETLDNGWVYTFIYEDYKDESIDDSGINKYCFYGMNIRYQYDDDYIQIQTQQLQDKIYNAIVVPTCLIAGKGPAAESRDMELINKSILDRNKSVEELLALNPDDYEFESIDKDMFFRLMRTALTGEPQKEGSDQTYWDKPTWAFLTEPEYIDGYKFQLAFMHETGCVDELFIDVRYETGSKYNDFVQLSDIIENGTATNEQNQIYEKIQLITNDIKINESYIVNAAEYQDVVIGEIDFSRLYTMLNNLHLNNYVVYISGQQVEIIE